MFKDKSEFDQFCAQVVEVVKTAQEGGPAYIGLGTLMQVCSAWGQLAKPPMLFTFKPVVGEQDDGGYRVDWNIALPRFTELYLSMEAKTKRDQTGLTNPLPPIEAIKKVVQEYLGQDVLSGIPRAHLSVLYTVIECLRVEGFKNWLYGMEGENLLIHIDRKGKHPVHVTLTFDKSAFAKVDEYLTPKPSVH